MSTTTLRTAAREARRRPRQQGLAARAGADRAASASAPTRTLPVVIDELAERFGDAPALLSDREQLQLPRNWPSARAATPAGRWTRAWAKGDVVALMMPNRPEYMAIWLGLSRLGVTTALINTQLRGASLAHCLNVAAAAPHHRRRHVCSAGLADVAQTLDGAPQIWLHGAAMTDWRIDLARRCLRRRTRWPRSTRRRSPSPTARC